jgi:hypothetical protein
VAPRHAASLALTGVLLTAIGWSLFSVHEPPAACPARLVAMVNPEGDTVYVDPAVATLDDLTYCRNRLLGLLWNRMNRVIRKHAEGVDEDPGCEQEIYDLADVQHEIDRRKGH